jgi:calcineurin-like phosphoesterase family protein
MLFPTQYDVGVDNNDYTPLSWKEVEEKIGKQLLKSKFKKENKK